MEEYELPQVIRDLVTARDAVRDHYAEIMEANGMDARLNFVFDGNLVGDIGEAIATEIYGVTLTPNAGYPGIDGYAPDGRTVQVKCTASNHGPAYAAPRPPADILLFFRLDLVNYTATTAYNGPESLVMAFLPERFVGPRSVSPNQILRASERIEEGAALLPIGVNAPIEHILAQNI